MKPYEEQSIPERLINRARIRRSATDRKSVQENKPDRLSDLLEEAAIEIWRLNGIIRCYENQRKGNQ